MISPGIAFREKTSWIFDAIADGGLFVECREDDGDIRGVHVRRLGTICNFRNYRMY